MSGDLTEPEPDPSTESPTRAGERRRGFVKELPILVIGALVVAMLIKSFLIQVFYIPSGSMLEALQIDDKVTVNKLAYRISEPQRGDVVVFENSAATPESLVGALVRNFKESLGQQDPTRHLIKRVIGLPGETIEVRDGEVLIDGEAIDEPYLSAVQITRAYGAIVIPDGHFFVMGDNRNSSSDSRVFGPIERERIVGRAIAVVWPPNHWSGL